MRTQISTAAHRPTAISRTGFLRLPAVTTLAVLAMLAPADAARGDVPPGFQAKLGSGGVSTECFVSDRRLTCLLYGRSPVRGGRACTAGGAVATVTLGTSGRARLSNTCVDEGYHGWDFLRTGETFRSGRFVCRNRGRSLRCSRRTRHFTVERKGNVKR